MDKCAIELKCFEMRSHFIVHLKIGCCVVSFLVKSLNFNMESFPIFQKPFHDNKYYKIIVVSVCPILFNFCRGILDWSQSIHNLLLPVSIFYFLFQCIRSRRNRNECTRTSNKPFRCTSDQQINEKSNNNIHKKDSKIQTQQRQQSWKKKKSTEVPSEIVKKAKNFACCLWHPDYVMHVILLQLSNSWCAYFLTALFSFRILLCILILIYIFNLLFAKHLKHSYHIFLVFSLSFGQWHEWKHTSQSSFSNRYWYSVHQYSRKTISN